LFELWRVPCSRRRCRDLEPGPCRGIGVWDARVGGGGERSERRKLQDGSDDAIVEAAAHGQADGAEGELHVGVAGEDGGGEREQATFVVDDGESFEEQRGDTLSVVVVGDGKPISASVGWAPMVYSPISISRPSIEASRVTCSGPSPTTRRSSPSGSARRSPKNR